MREVELLATKNIVSARATTAAVSITTSGGTYRFRVSMKLDDFKFLYDILKGATSPKGSVWGTASQGLAVKIDMHTGNRVTVAGQSTVFFSHSGRLLDTAEQIVKQTAVHAVLVEYDDGSHYMWLEPLPDSFLSSSKQRHRFTPAYRPFQGVVSAFEHAGVSRLTWVPTAAPAAPTPVPELVVPTEPLPVAAPPALTEAAPRTVPLSVKDLKEAIGLINLYASELRKTGAEVALRVEDGAIKARISLVLQEEL